MQRLISLFASIQHEPQLSQPASGPPPGPKPDYGQDPEYFQHLIAYLREQRDGQEIGAEGEAFDEPDYAAGLRQEEVMA